jgi:hypothetical protein
MGKAYSNFAQEYWRSVRKFYFLRNICGKPLNDTFVLRLNSFKIVDGLISWGGTSKTFVNRLQVSLLPLHFKLRIRIMSNHKLLGFKVLTLFYLKSGNRSTDNLYDMRSVDRMLSKTLKVNRVLFRHSYLYLAPCIFNRIPMKIRRYASHSTVFFVTELGNGYLK